jgi:hypothetical protein
LANLEYNRPQAPAPGLWRAVRNLLGRRSQVELHEVRWLGPHIGEGVKAAIGAGKAVRLIFGNSHGEGMCKHFGGRPVAFDEGSSLNALVHFASFTLVLWAVRNDCSARGMIHDADANEYAVELVPGKKAS